MEQLDDKFREIFNQSPIGIIFHDKKGITVDANNSALKIMAISRLDDILGLSMFDNPPIEEKREELINDGVIQFQAPLDLDMIKNLGFYTPTKNGVLFLDYTVSVTDSGFLVQIQDVKGQEKADKLLKESEEKFSKAFYSNSAGMVIATLDGEIIEVNEAYANITGYKREELLGQKSTDLNILSAEAREEIVKRLFNGDSIFNEEFEIRAKTGEKRQILYTSEFIEFGGEKRAFTIIYDITERKKAEEAVVFQAQLLAQTGEAILSSDANYNINYWNKAAEKTFGWTKEEALGKNSGELLKTKIEDSSRAQEVSKMWKEGHWEGEAQYLRKDGKYFIANVNAKILKDVNEKDIGIVTVVQDITERKKAEEVLKESEEKFSKVFYSSPTAIIISTLEGSIIDVNEQYTSITGYNKDEIIGKNTTEINLYGKEYRDKLLEKLLKEGHIHDMEIEISDKWDKKHILLISTEFIELKGKKHLISLFYDITERKKVEEILKDGCDFRLNYDRTKLMKLFLALAKVNLKFRIFNKAADIIIGLRK